MPEDFKFEYKSTVTQEAFDQARKDMREAFKELDTSAEWTERVIEIVIASASIALVIGGTVSPAIAVWEQIFVQIVSTLKDLEKKTDEDTTKS